MSAAIREIEKARIVDAIRGGDRTAKEIAETTRLPVERVRRRAKQLVAEGRVHAEKNYRYDSQGGWAAQQGLFGGAGVVKRVFWQYSI